MRKNTYICASVVLSVLIHAAFLLLIADRLKLDYFSPSSLGKDKKDRDTIVVPIDIRTLQNRQTSRDEADPKQTLKDLSDVVKQSEKLQNIFKEHNLVEMPPPKLKLSDLGRDLLSDPKPPEATPPRQATAPRPDIVSIDARKLSPEQLASSRPIIPMVPRKAISAKAIPSLLPHGDLAGGSGQTFTVGMQWGAIPLSKAPEHVPLPIDPSAKSGSAGSSAKGSITSVPKAPDLQIGIRPGEDTRTVTPGVTVHQLDKLMTVNMFVYHETGGGGFFRVDISPNPRSERLRAVSKDILFLIDCSNSISAAKLKQFKEAVVDALPYLTKRDRFNVVSFRDSPEAMFPQFMPVTDENVQQGCSFVTKIQRGGMTDVFAGLAPCVEPAADGEDPYRPLNIFLMSDGQSTVKDSLSNDVFIRRILELKRANVSIYSFSAGKDVNRFLLDFLAFHNRGLSLHQEELRNFTHELVEFISTHATLIVSDLKYHVAGELGGDIYPKKLPHLYRGETLHVFGRFNRGDEEVVLSIVGRDATGDLQEIIFRGSIKDSPKASPQIALEWAAQKIYHLIGLRTLSPSVEVQNEIRKTAQKYNLYVPY